MKKSKSFLKLTFIFLLISHCCFSQESDDRKFQVGLNGNFFISGELNSIYDTSVGVEGAYFFKHTPKFHHFFNAGFTTEIGRKGTNLYAFDLGIGTQYDIAKLWKKQLYLQLSAGALYLEERFSIQLIERTIDTSVSEFGFKANFGIGYQLTKKLSLQINATQFTSKGTSAGLGIYYTF